MSAPEQPAALLLTGGASRRMGRDKARLNVGGCELATRTASLVSRVAAPVLEVGPGYTALPRVQETPTGGGPLCAVAAGWVGLVDRGWPKAAAVLAVATDLPRLTVGLLELLAGHDGTGCVVPVDEDGRAQPLCARYPMAALAEAARLVREGRRAIHDLLDRVDVTWLPPAAWQSAAGRTDALVDVDTPADLAALTDPVARPAP